MTAREHYEHHLGNFYSWMAGDFESKSQEFVQYLRDKSIVPAHTGVAIDLGAGHGIQSVALASGGFAVTAIDFNQQLLDELRARDTQRVIQIRYGDIQNTALWPAEPELIVCWGDTLTHLTSLSDVQQLIQRAAHALIPGGKFIASLRDYSQPLTGTSRFIPVKSDAHRILTCVLEYTDTHVQVTDLLHERTDAGWVQRVSSYEKIRIDIATLIDMLESAGFTVQHQEVINRMTAIVACKQ